MDCVLRCSDISWLCVTLFNFCLYIVVFNYFLFVCCGVEIILDCVLQHLFISELCVVVFSYFWKWLSGLCLMVMAIVGLCVVFSYLLTVLQCLVIYGFVTLFSYFRGTYCSLQLFLDCMLKCLVISGVCCSVQLFPGCMLWCLIRNGLCMSQCFVISGFCIYLFLRQRCGVQLFLACVSWCLVISRCVTVFSCQHVQLFSISYCITTLSIRLGDVDFL